MVQLGGRFILMDTSYRLVGLEGCWDVFIFFFSPPLSLIHKHTHTHTQKHTEFWRGISLVPVWRYLSTCVGICWGQTVLWSFVLLCMNFMWLWTPHLCESSQGKTVSSLRKHGTQHEVGCSTYLKKGMEIIPLWFYISEHTLSSNINTLHISL